MKAEAVGEVLGEAGVQVKDKGKFAHYYLVLS
jgi:hypothetical protein